VPSYLGCSLSFVGVAAVIRAQGGTSATVTGAVFVVGVGGVTLKFTDTFSLNGIALGTLVVITGYHALRAMAPAHLKTQEPLVDEGTSSYDEERYDEERAPEAARAAKTPESAKDSDQRASS